MTGKPVVKTSSFRIIEHGTGEYTLERVLGSAHIRTIDKELVNAILEMPEVDDDAIQALVFLESGESWQIQQPRIREMDFGEAFDLAASDVTGLRTPEIQ